MRMPWSQISLDHRLYLADFGSSWKGAATSQTVLLAMHLGYTFIHSAMSKSVSLHFFPFKDYKQETKHCIKSG